VNISVILKSKVESSWPEIWCLPAIFLPLVVWTGSGTSVAVSDWQDLLFVDRMVSWCSFRAGGGHSAQGASHSQIGQRCTQIRWIFLPSLVIDLGQKDLLPGGKGKLGAISSIPVPSQTFLTGSQGMVGHPADVVELSSQPWHLLPMKSDLRKQRILDLRLQWFQK
jgi:hypothetical protein